MDRTTLGNRMKGYEATSKSQLLRRTPVIIRIDGKAFHTWTNQNLKKDVTLHDGPFSHMMHDVMSDTLTDLMSNIQNAVFGYTQSDEISILLNDWKKVTTDQWFNGAVQKIASVSASMATAYSNHRYTLIIKNKPFYRNAIVHSSGYLHTLHLEISVSTKTYHILIGSGQLSSD